MLVAGPESSGKTYLAHKLQAQLNLINWETGEIDPTYSNPTPTCWVDTEGTLDPVWAEKIGVLNDPDVNVHVLPPHGEAAIDIVYDAIVSGSFGAVFLDSVDAALIQEEQEKSAEEAVVGKKAKAMNSMFRKVTSACNELLKQSRNGEIPAHRIPLFYAINQPREQIGVLFGDPSFLPGGKGQKFYSSVLINMHTAKVSDTSAKEGGVVTMKGVVKKNKTGMPKETFTFDVAILNQSEDWMAGTVDNAKALFPHVKERLMGEKTKEGYPVLDKMFAKQSDIKDELRSNPTFYERCRKKIFDQILEVVEEGDDEHESSSDSE
jgi:recombination protein RecA